jgi:restriction endonuclease Mrr
MRVEQVMRGSLKQVDYEPLPSDGTQRWSKSAQWARNRIAREGLLKSDSPRGIWEISDKGRQVLTKDTR